MKGLFLNNYRSLDLSTRGMKDTTSFCLLTCSTLGMNKSVFSPSSYARNKNIRAFSSTPSSGGVFAGNINTKPSIFKNYSVDKGVSQIKYKISENVYLNDMFKDNIAEILEDLYDNNEFVIFKLYYIRKPRVSFSMDEVKLFKHLDGYPLEFLMENLTRFHINMGLVGCSYIMVWTSNCDIKNLKVIASGMREQLLSNISNINKDIHVDYGNTIVNFNTPMDLLNELYLFIGVDRSNPHMISACNNFYKKSSRGGVSESSVTRGAPSSEMSKCKILSG